MPAKLEPGVYYLDEFPKIPQHPNCQCFGTPVTVHAIEVMLAQLRGEAGIPRVGRPGQGDLDISKYYKDLSAGGSATPYLIPDGKGGWMFTPERQELHDQIVASFLRGVPQSADPKVYMLGGGPAAGKSTILNSGLISDVPSTEDREAVLVNPDEVKLLLPEYQHMQAEGGQARYDSAPFVHEESSYLSKRIRAAAIELQDDVVADAVGTNYDEVIGQAAPEGYDVQGYYVFVDDPQLAVDRAVKRGEETGRTVYPSYVLAKHQEVAQKFPDAAGKLDTVVLYDTTVTPPTLVAHKDESGELIIDDSERYALFLSLGKVPA